ncbi:MAG: menaquinone via futalosine step 1 [Campylobacteraceae bacterium]|nr:menaquinone via futalosine step 1 [Campylobacteraceae bacterium]
MTFGKIDYINLLPFHIFLKKQPLCNSFKQSIACKKSYPSKLNEKLKKRQIDAAFVSSIASAQKGLKTINAGIVATKEVQSVLVKAGSYKQDPHSATSNLLAKILKVEGEVVIGDRALKFYLENPQNYTDLAKLWHEKYNLPFVFARLSVNRYYDFYKRIGEKFANQKIFIPSYILNNYEEERGIKAKDIKTYLKNLSYKVDAKANYGLKTFLRASRLFKITN